MARTARARYEADELTTKEKHARFMNDLEYALEVADFMSDEAPNTATQDVQETACGGTSGAFGAIGRAELSVGSALSRFCEETQKSNRDYPIREQ